MKETELIEEYITGEELKARLKERLKKIFIERNRQNSMDKKELIEQKKKEREAIQKQIDELTDRDYELSHKIEELSAPDIPVEMIGKFLKEEDDNHVTVIRVDNITSSAAGESLIQFHGYGFKKMKRHGNHIIQICNNLMITMYTDKEDEFRMNHNYKIVEITVVEFTHYLDSAYKEIVNKIEYKEN